MIQTSGSTSNEFRTRFDNVPVRRNIRNQTTDMRTAISGIRNRSNAGSRHRVAVLALALISLLQYSLILRNPLLLDSHFVILEDESIRSLANIPAFFAQ